MKKILYLSLMAIVSLLIASCSNDSPGSALKHYMEAMFNKNFEEAFNGYAIKDGNPSELPEPIKKSLFDSMESAIEEITDQHGAIKSIEIISEEISEDGTTAEVEYKQVFEDGTEDEGTQTMVKKDGKWLIDVGL
ncbi:DUF4878 domain-containing protein [Barnesiella sp. An55]|uniref:DUF4878 domain-containing protein n=1 Tax=Barnesiella sp. An55 TaxID=1965646 RepID=UPI000B374187|nr:DUF4878 domain-containing protein [Barnesiella sp. An55]OUN73742.1 hypothetical protein B5G10_04065 [Barnesiella sp. An55]